MNITPGLIGSVVVGLIVLTSTGCVEIAETLTGEGSIASIAGDNGEMTFTIDAALPAHEEGESCQLVYGAILTIADCDAGFQAMLVSQTDEDLQACEELFDESVGDFAACLAESDCYRVAAILGRYEARSCSGNRGNGKGDGRNNKKGNGKALGHDKNPTGEGAAGAVVSSGCMVAYYVDQPEDSTMDAVAVLMVDDNGDVFYTNCGQLTSGAIDSTPLDDCDTYIFFDPNFNNDNGTGSTFTIQ